MTKSLTLNLMFFISLIGQSLIGCGDVGYTEAIEVESFVKLPIKQAQDTEYVIESLTVSTEQHDSIDSEEKTEEYDELSHCLYGGEYLYEGDVQIIERVDGSVAQKVCMLTVLYDGTQVLMLKAF